MKKYSTAISIGLVVLGIGALLLHFLWSDSEENAEYDTDATVNEGEGGEMPAEGAAGEEAPAGEAYPSQGMPAQAEAPAEGEAASGGESGQAVKQETGTVAGSGEGAAKPEGEGTASEGASEEEEE
jgi:hypothetical protein